MTYYYHNRKKGPGNSIGVNANKNNPAGTKLARAAHNGLCGLRHGVGAAGRLALEGKLGKK